MAKAKATAPESTGEEREAVGHGKPPKEHQFKPGNPGRPKGSRNKLGEAFVTALHEDFALHGKEAIEKVRDDDPAAYVRVIASILPKQVEIKEGAFDGIGDDELAALIVAARSALGVADPGRGGTEPQDQPQPPGELPAVH